MPLTGKQILEVFPDLYVNPDFDGSLEEFVSNEYIRPEDILQVVFKLGNLSEDLTHVFCMYALSIAFRSSNTPYRTGRTYKVLDQYRREEITSHDLCLEVASISSTQRLKGFSEDTKIGVDFPYVDSSAYEAVLRSILEYMRYSFKSLKI